MALELGSFQGLIHRDLRRAHLEVMVSLLPDADVLLVFLQVGGNVRMTKQTLNFLFSAIFVEVLLMMQRH